VTALKHVVANIAGLEGQSNDVKVKKLAEGASNKVMTATVGRQRYIVKVPDPLVPRRLVTASEVATLEFLRAELELPVPKVLAWSDSDDNAVGCEYIIMEEAAGHDLKTTWPALGLGQRTEVVDQIIAIQERLIQASKAFRGYGSLYFTSDAQKFKFRRQIDLSSTKSSRFIIGPLAHEHFMEPVLSKTGIDNGPCKFLILRARLLFHS
jgi:aminoglycoside phosphotransferase (APT) family kinase protein